MNDVHHESSGKLSNVRILVMDDDEVICMLVKEMLEMKGAEVCTVANGDDAIVTYKKEKQEGKAYHLVIMDLQVHGGTGGEETIKKLHEADPGVAIIISSGYVDDSHVEEYVKYGVKGIIIKPFTEKELEGKINTIIGTA